LSNDARWVAFENALNQHTIRVYELSTERVHVDSTTASAYARVSEEGLFQFGHSKDHRPDLLQVKMMQAVLDPLAMPLATDIVSGEGADDPLYIPCIERVQESLQRRGLLFVGDCKKAAHDTRAFISLAGVSYLCPLPQRLLGEGELETALERVWSGDQGLMAVFREDEHGEAKPIAQGYESNTAMSVEVDGVHREWMERRLVVHGPVMVLCCWAKGEADPLYLVSNLSLAEEAIKFYKQRFRIETFFSDQQSRGFNIQKSHIENCQRLSRLLIASCLAYIWIIYLGSLCKTGGWQSIIHRKSRCDFSLFQLGYRLLEYFLNEILPIPVQFYVII
jgi:hypothetical protein